MGKKKGKKNQIDADWEDDVQNDLLQLTISKETDGNIEQLASSTTIPSKKNKKKSKVSDNWEDDVQNEISNLNGDEKEQDNDTIVDSSVQKGGKKGKKKKKRDVDDWEDDIQNEIAQLNAPPTEEIESNKNVSEETIPTQSKKTKKGKGKKEMDNWEDDVLNEISQLDAPKAEKDDNNEVEQPAPTVSSKKGKKGKKSRKGDDDDWENDVQNEIAALNDPETATKASLPETSGQDKDGSPSIDGGTNTKSKKKKKKKNVEAPTTNTPEPATTSTPEPVAADDAEDNEGSKKDKKKKKKKGAKGEEKEEKTKRKPNKAALAMMKEALRRQKEEEERLQKEEEERIRKEEEAEQARLAELERERLKKEEKKQAKKDRIKQLKAEGKYLTPAQREAQKKREAFLESLKAQGITIPEKGDTVNKKPNYGKRKGGKRDRNTVQQSPSPTVPVSDSDHSITPLPEENGIEEKEESNKEVPDTAEEDDKDSELDDWDKMSLDEDSADNIPTDSVPEKIEMPPEPKRETTPPVEIKQKSEVVKSKSEKIRIVDDNLSDFERAKKRIEKRRDIHESNRSVKELRSPVICVMGHVDTGKTKILDKLRHSNVQDGEAGGITQQIGATNVPPYTIEEQTKMVKKFSASSMRIPGLLLIDTPGHESFSNLRSRGSSNCDMAILVVDIMHGLEPQTIESINMLKKRKTPFVVALNKIDRLYEWKMSPHTDVETVIKNQKKYVQDEFNERTSEIIVQFAEQGLNVKLFYENDDPKTWISLVPTSAHSGDGMGNLIALVVQLCQTMLAKRLSYSEHLQCTVLEVKAIQGLGTTVDVILTNGRLKYGDTIVLAGVEGPIVTHVKGLLMPQPLKELRVKNAYEKFNEIKAAQGVKILAKELDKALAGTSLLVAEHDDEVEVLMQEVQAEVDAALKNIKLQERGVFVQASTLGSLEALLEFLKQSKIPYAGIGIGPVHKRDVMKASVMLEHDTQWAVILAFDVKVEREAQELADSLQVQIFTADIIYHLFDAFMQHRESLKKQKQEEFRDKAVFPCKLSIVPNCVFKSRDPIVIGVKVEAGQLRLGTPLCVPSKEFLTVGIVTGMQFDHKTIDHATKSQEVCIKIEGAPGDTPKMVGRHFDETDILVSKITRDSINILKDWFREEMTKSDWQLIIEFKKAFEII